MFFQQIAACIIHRRVLTRKMTPKNTSTHLREFSHIFFPPKSTNAKNDVKKHEKTRQHTFDSFDACIIHRRLLTHTFLKESTFITDSVGCNAKNDIKKHVNTPFKNDQFWSKMSTSKSTHAKKKHQHTFESFDACIFHRTLLAWILCHFFMKIHASIKISVHNWPNSTQKYSFLYFWIPTKSNNSHS